MRDDGLNATAEEAEEIVDQSALRRAAGDGRFEDVRVADFLHALDRLLRFEAVDHRLHRRIGRALLLREALLNLTDRGGAAVPERVHDLMLESRQLRQCHAVTYQRGYIYYNCR